MFRLAFTLACLFSVSDTDAAPALKDKKQDDKTRIVGQWKLEAMCMRGGRMDTERDSSMRFSSDGTCGITHNGGKENEAVYFLDPEANPRKMKWLNGAQRTEWVALYEFDGDKLKVAFVDQGTEAPKTIEPAPNLTIYYLKRMKD